MGTRAMNRPLCCLPPLKPVVLAALAALAGPSLAQPVTNQLPVRNATAPINATVGAATGTAGNPMLPVTQQTSANNRAVVEWSSFNVGSGARVDFVQPNAQSVLLNRVVGGSGNSQIYGSLTANGRIFIVNPFGVYFGGSSQVNVGSLVASSLDLTPAMADNNYLGFLNGTGVDLAGSGQFGVQTASDSAANKITAAQGGSVALIGSTSISDRTKFIVRAERACPSSSLLGSGRRASSVNSGPLIRSPRYVGKVTPSRVSVSAERGLAY